MTEAEYNQRIDALVARRDALWARYDALVATHGVWSDEAGEAVIAADNAAKQIDALAREYRVELER